jgi:hypothetical protein
MTPPCSRTFKILCRLSYAHITPLACLLMTIARLVIVISFLMTPAFLSLPMEKLENLCRYRFPGGERLTGFPVPLVGLVLGLQSLASPK